MCESVEDEIDWLNQQKSRIEAELSRLAGVADAILIGRLSRAHEAHELLIALLESKRLRRRQSRAA